MFNSSFRYAINNVFIAVPKTILFFTPLNTNNHVRQHTKLELLFYRRLT